MANEIDYRHTATGDTLYMVRKAGGEVWDGSDLVTMVVADWADYAIALTETPASSYRYLGSMTGLPRGTYDVEIYQQAGATAAITDTLLATGSVLWTGYAAVSSASVVATNSSYLTLVNKVLKRITQPEITSIATATGQAKIISELINEAQNELWTEANNWYSLYSTRDIATVAGTSTYALASDWGRTIDLVDVTNDRPLTEDNLRAFNFADPNEDFTGTPLSFAIQGSNYIIYPIPSGVVTIRDRYWKIPSTLTADSDVSDLPLFCENFIIHWSLMSVLQYLQKYEAADKVALKIYGNPAMKDPGILQKAKLSNEKIINKMFRMGGNSRANNGYNGIDTPRFPSSYGRMS